jgi:hypothetical protein
MIKYTFFYVVGGQDVYYNQLYKSLKSLSRLKSDKFKVKILDVDNKFDIHFNTDFSIELFKTNVKLSTKEDFWKYKYFICQQLDTDYGIYLDCDTVVCYDRLKDISDRLGNGFGVVPHFHIKDFCDFRTIFNNYQFTNVNDSCCFYTGGVFFFYNNIDNKNILKEIFEMHSIGTNQSLGFYDETYLSLSLSNKKCIKLNGSFNHCSANYMPLKIHDNTLIGKNNFDDQFEKIFVLHGSSERQINGEDFDGEIKKTIQNFWNI